MSDHNKQAEVGDSPSWLTRPERLRTSRHPILPTDIPCITTDSQPERILRSIQGQLPPLLVNHFFDKK